MNAISHFAATDRDVSLRVLRWSARVLSLLAVGVLLSFAFGMQLNLSQFAARELALFVFFPLGVCLGLVLAWRWEGLGGGIAVASLAAFYLLHRLLSSGYPRGVAFAVLASPGLLFLLCWSWTRSTAKQPAPAAQPPRGD
jgi:hypothetical protein